MDIFYGIFLILSLAATANAQSSNATCIPEWSWTTNSRQQTPCLVAAYLIAPCENNQWNVPALGENQFYQPPAPEFANSCLCSSVVYQLMSACGSCQAQNIVAWSTWKRNCTAAVTTMAAYPREVPSGTAIPAWAFLNITVLDRFDARAAQAAVGQPDLTIGTPQSTISTSRSTTSSTSSTSVSSSSTETSPSSSSTSTTVITPPSDTRSSKNDTPAIVGGVVGGIVGLGLIVCLFIYLIKRNKETKKKRAPSAEFSKAMPPGSPIPANFDTAAVGFRSGTTSPLMGHGLSDSSNGNGYQMGNIYQSNTSVGAVSYGGSPWSPPPVGHTPAPHVAPYPSVFTPAPQSVSPRLNHLNYTPPPGSMMSGVSAPYSHSHSGSVSHGQPFQIPHGGGGGNAPHGAAVIPEM